MTTPESKEKCCEQCRCVMGTTHPSGYCNCDGCSKSACHCHQRTESECNIDPIYSGICDRGTKCCTEPHQRPESSWEKDFNKEFACKSKRCSFKSFKMPHLHQPNGEIQPIIDFIARHTAAAYQRGQEDADTRLLKNNTDLQAKLREGNRAILDELEKLWSHKAWHEISCPAHSNQMRPEHECDCVFSLMPELIQYLLSFQQEPQEKQPEV